MPLATPIPNDCADRDKKSGGLLSVAGGPGENDDASGTAGTKKRKVVVDDEGDDALDGLLRSSPKERLLSSGSGSGHCHYPPHPGWWNGGCGNYASPHPHQWQNDAAPLLPVLIDNRWVQIYGHPWAKMTVQVWKNVSTPINQPQWMLLNNVWVWMCVHGMEEQQRLTVEKQAKKKAMLEFQRHYYETKKEADLEAEIGMWQERQRLKEEKQAKKNAKLEEQQRLKAEKQAKKNAKLEEQQRLKAEKLEEQQRLKAVTEAKKKAMLEFQQRFYAEKEAKRAELEEQKAKAAAEKKAVRDAKKAELEEQKAKAAEKEILRLQQWLGKELVGLDEVKVAARLRKYINTKQKEVLDQIIPLWMKNDEDSKAKVNSLLMSLKRGRLSMKKEHIVRYIRLKVYTEISLIKPFSTDPYLRGIRTRVHYIMKERGDSYVIWGSSAPRTPPSKDEFIRKACMITRDIELAERFAQDLYIS